MSETKFEPRSLSGLDLAFVGDGVYELLVREYLARQGSRPVGELHRMAVSFVNASAQAKAYEVISPMLTEGEQAIFRRGRNSGAHPPRNANPGDYARATGFEALFGYLHLAGEQQRIRELFAAIIEQEG